MITNDTLLELSEVNKQFDGLLAIADVSFHLNSGEIVSLIGPNGAGKTTILNLISGVYPPTSGDILLNGESIKGFKPHQIAKKRVSRTFQSVQIFQEMTVMENILLGLHHRLRSGFVKGMVHFPAERREEQRAIDQARDTLEHFGIGHLAQRRADSDQRKNCGGERVPGAYPVSEGCPDCPGRIRVGQGCRIRGSSGRQNRWDTAWRQAIRAWRAGLPWVPLFLAASAGPAPRP